MGRKIRRSPQKLTGFDAEARKLWPIIDEAIKTLRLKWKVVFEEGAPSNETCSILSNPIVKKHLIMCVRGIIHESDSGNAEILHELCHAHLGEKRGILFATHHFAGKYNGKRDDPDFLKKHHYLRQSVQVPADMWANDLRNKHWEELGVISAVNNYEHILKIVKSGTIQALYDSRGGPDALVIIGAELRRYREILGDVFVKKGDGMVSDIVDAIEPEEMSDKMKRLIEYNANLPELPEKPEEALALLEKTVRDNAEIKGLSIRPKIIHEKKKGAVWTFGD
jgi:hypothetical protein